MESDIPGRWEHIGKHLRRNGPFSAEGFEADTPTNKTNMKFLRDEIRILVIGAGGLGCELLKDLALLGFRNIDVIDMDTIDATNLNRQFLFRKDDIGKPKAEVAAAFINKRIAGANVIPHYCRIQSKPPDFYEQFQIVICGLDSIDARRWINSLLINLVDVDEDGKVDRQTVIPMIDGGTEGFKGQVRVIIPRMTSCFECSVEAFPPQKTYPICTLASTPRIPEHCIQWASIVHWDEVKPFGAEPDPNNLSALRAKKIDTDNQEHMKWLYERAKERADANNISGVTYKLTQGVVKNIIPAIASTNAVVSAGCANEAFKIAINISNYLNNYMMYMGNNGLYTYTFEYQKKIDCAACGSQPITISVEPQKKLQEFLDILADNPATRFKKASIRCSGKNIFMQGPPQLLELTKPNLEKPLNELINNEDFLDVTDPSLQGAATIKIIFKS